MLMLLVQFGIGLTDVWAAGRIGPDIQASIGLIAQCHMVLMAVGIATGNGAVAAVSQSIGAGRQRRARLSSRYIYGHCRDNTFWQ